MPGVIRLLLVATMLCWAPITKAAGQSSPVVDRDKLLITLSRSGCFGPCPRYTVTINGHGHVIFDSAPPPTEEIAKRNRELYILDGILVDGRHEDAIAIDEVDRLVEQFQIAGFLDLRGSYGAANADLPTHILTIDTGSGPRRVVDNVSAERATPNIVIELERAVDRAAGTDRWTNGGAGLLEWLDRTGFDFTSPKAGAIAADGAWGKAAEETLLGFVERGAPLEQEAWFGPRLRVPVGEALLRGAIMRGLPLVFDRITELGWLDRVGRSEVGVLLSFSAGGCRPALIAAAADAGVSLNERDPEGDTALRSLWRRCRDAAAQLETARALLERGADPNLPNEKGETALFDVSDPVLVDLLYAHGADGSIKDESGNSAIFWTTNEEVILRHLEHGASVDGRFFGKRTLHEQLAQSPMPRVESWLAAHGD